ncbi:MAG TPA: hypothetical protein PLI27_04305 [Ignavibacteriales bacterium]|nr:hypothetical protein [Ignavibacteriales bacterium]HOL80555.1 hypothetical protein [Ignavibacteriales bacterium]HOM64244.1 hypothetical protein [Ignavibacteriales bacterium]HPD67282.1 hypothetical protein [Ignavibacteriales bacterium]HPP33110.1 hypothetical protein [Ignavibacteriales bacterium]
MEAVQNNVRLNYNYNLEYTNKAVQNYRRVAALENPKQQEVVKQTQDLTQQAQNEQFSRVQKSDMNNVSRINDANTNYSYTPIASLSSQMNTPVIGYTAAGKILTEKQTLGFNIKI